METTLAFLSPLGLAWSALGIWLTLSARRRRAGELVLAAVSWTFLTLAACTPLPSLLLATLETRFPAVAVAELETADAIVCLGGGASPSDAEPAGIHLRGSADRLATALLLARGGRAPVLVLGGGGYLIHGAWRSEAEAVTDALRPPGGTGPEILGLGLCANTRDEAVKVAQLARERGWNRVHLVTSAYHLPRAVAAFRRAGMVVQPIPCNFQTASTTGQTSRWFGAPGTAGLEHLELWLHEILGGILYRWKGWA
ncbi:MAG: YdcF family protein [Verrucomicrobia bacterium]|nr:YdcF family protein [Verrucomicrobiota bacterium]